MRWLVTGANGMLGQDMVAALATAGEKVLPMSRIELDITDESAVRRSVRQTDVVVNCAAWTAVDDAESFEADAFQVNAIGSSLLAGAARDAGARLVQISTDYVFDGEARQPYSEDHAPRPLSAYGRTKAAGEWAVQASGGDHLIIRTGWLYGAGGACFPRSINQAASRKQPLTVVNDQTGQPTWSADLANLVLAMVAADAPAGVYHGTSTGRTTWWGFARLVLQSAGYDPSLAESVSSQVMKRPAHRPAFSVLASDSLKRAGVQPLGRWEDRWHAAAESVLLSSVNAEAESRLS